MSEKHEIKEVRARIRASGNPYASLGMKDDVMNETETTNERKHAYLKLMENPYATHAIFGDSDSENRIEVPAKLDFIAAPAASPRKISKKDFRANCQRIFSQYVPHGGKLIPTHHRHFIIRNEIRTAEQRFQILSKLARYDISATGNYQAQFNREKDLLTGAKLQAIENELDGNSEDGGAK